MNNVTKIICFLVFAVVLYGLYYYGYLDEILPHIPLLKELYYFNHIQYKTVEIYYTFQIEPEVIEKIKSKIDQDLNTIEKARKELYNKYSFNRNSKYKTTPLEEEFAKSTTDMMVSNELNFMYSIGGVNNILFDEEHRTIYLSKKNKYYVVRITNIDSISARDFAKKFSKYIVDGNPVIVIRLGVKGEEIERTSPIYG